MNAVDVLRSAFNAAHYWYDGTTADVTNEQSNYVPEGLAHPIGELMAHTVQSEDTIINGLVQHQPTVWDRGQWSDRLGLPNMSIHTSEAARAFRADPAALRAYTEEVYAATNAYFDGLTDTDLDREVDMSGFGMEPQKLGDVLVMFALGNTFAHTGEISTLKGIQGSKGYPF